MTASLSQGKSLDQLEHEAERNRAILTDTVEELKDRVQDEAGELRERISPANIKAEVSDYVRTTGLAWRDSLEQRARDNPLQTAALGVGLAYPLWKLVRSIPAPLLLVGAGIALTRTSASHGGASLGAGLLDEVTDRFQQTKDGVTSAVADLGANLGHTADRRIHTVTGGIDAVRSTGSSALDTVTAKVGDGYAAAAEATTRYASTARETVTATWRDGSRALSHAQDRSVARTARAGRDALSALENNPLLLAGAGLVFGAIIAAAIPSTQLESRVLAEAAPDLKNKASDLIDQGYAAGSDAVASVYDKTLEYARSQGLSPDAVHAAIEGLGQKVKSVAGAALDPDHAGASTNASSNNTSENGS